MDKQTDSVQYSQEEVSVPSVLKEKPKNHRFQKGKSGNPLGRPKGSKNKSTIVKEALKAEAEDLLVKHLPDVVKEVIRQAKQGNMVAAKMLLDRAIPVKRAVEVTGKDGEDFGVRIVIENLMTYDSKQEDIEDVEYEEIEDGK